MYEENFYSLDEAQMGKVPGTANIHNIIKGNVLAKKITPQGGHSSAASRVMRATGLSGHDILNQTKALPKVMSPEMQSKVQAGLHHIKNMAKFAKSGAKSLLAREEASTPDGSANNGVALGVGLGKPHADGNHLYQIPINNYDDSDASFVGDGEEKATSQTNIPAILAARQAGGMPDPKTVSNGINKRFKASLDPAMTDDNKNIQEGFLNSTAKKALKAARDLGHNMNAKHYGRLYNQNRKEFTSNGFGSKSDYSHMVKAGLDTLNQYKRKNPALYNSLKKS